MPSNFNCQPSIANAVVSSRGCATGALLGQTDKAATASALAKLLATTTRPLHYSDSLANLVGSLMNSLSSIPEG